MSNKLTLEEVATKHRDPSTLPREYYYLLGKCTRSKKYEVIFGDFQRGVVEQEKYDTSTLDYKGMRVVPVKDHRRALLFDRHTGKVVA